MKLLRTLIVAIACASCWSCMDYKLITRGNKITKVTAGPANPGDDFEQDYNIKNTCFGKVDNKGDYLLVSEVNSVNLEPVGTQIPLAGGASGFKGDIKGKYYAPNAGSPGDAGVDASKIRSFTYWDGKPVLQGISTVLKIRPKLDNYALKDSFPSYVETGFSPALALGWKFSRNTFLVNKDLFGRNIRQLSIAPGVLLGVGGVDLTKSNTRAPKITFPRKALFISQGGFLSLGYNNINLGYAWGKDYATGEDSKGWLYRGETWHAIIFGFDIIK